MMTVKKPQDPRIGLRVELSPACDLWMRGAKFGTVVDVKQGLLVVRMDHPQVKRLQRFTSDLLRSMKHGSEYGAELTHEKRGST